MRNYLFIGLAVLLAASLSAHANGAKESSGQASYAKLDPIVVNLQDLSQYVQVGLALKVAKPETIELVKIWNPVIRHELILIFSNQTGEELSTLAGKQKIRSVAKTTINKLLMLDATEGVTDVLFESFVVQ